MNKEMTVNGKSYTIIKLLGKGKRWIFLFGRVWK